MPLTIADAIETYLLQLVAAHRAMLEISRRELSERFRCAPSQINYVLETRFTPERGFVVRSRRGGGGGIFISPILYDGTAGLLRAAYQQAARGLSPVQARHVIRFLGGQGIVSEREALLMEAVAGRALLDAPDDSDRILRGRLMQSMLKTLMSQA